MKIIEVMKQVEEFILGKKEYTLYPWHEEKKEVKPKRKYRRRRVKKK
tara:strand:- start:358 stop:498 length:141 start_codon:yes stop_codon:yes gene_type:complete